jgi:hypothetical protein
MHLLVFYEDTHTHTHTHVNYWGVKWKGMDGVWYSARLWYEKFLQNSDGKSEGKVKIHRSKYRWEDDNKMCSYLQPEQKECVDCISCCLNIGKCVLLLHLGPLNRVLDNDSEQEYVCVVLRKWRPCVQGTLPNVLHAFKIEKMEFWGWVC